MSWRSRRMQSRFVGYDLVIRHAADHLIGLGDAALDGLEDLQPVFLKDIDGPLEPLIGDRMDMAIIGDGEECEQSNREDNGRHHGEPQ